MPGSEYYDRDYYKDDPIEVSPAVAKSTADKLNKFVSSAIASVNTAPDYKFNEGDYLRLVKDYIDSTYTQHYAVGKLQATEFIIDMGDGVGFCRGNVIKYAKRYGQKAGRNKDDLLKVIHYALMLLHVHDQETQGK